MLEEARKAGMAVWVEGARVEEGGETGGCGASPGMEVRMTDFGRFVRESMTGDGRYDG